MLSLIQEFQPQTVVMSDKSAVTELKKRTGIDKCTVRSGLSSLEELVTSDEVDQVVFASSGTDAIPALQKAIIANKDVSLANKESIVVAGPWVMPLVRRNDQLRPLDSEHNAIWHCLRGEQIKDVKRIYLTASGGPFRNMPREALEQVTVEMATRHPVWNMGKKISIDSATLMNKGIELIEAMNLFYLDPSQVKAVIHPSSFIHGMVEFKDNTVKMLASYPDMVLPAVTSMAFPNKLQMDNKLVPECDFGNLQLEFYSPDHDRFPCLALAMEAASKGGPYPSLLVSADEIAVESFLQKKISFMEIPLVISQVIDLWSGSAPASLDDCLQIMEWGRTNARSIVERMMRY
jgi:1-deoxy-D-xylulose-5-phosphate reductoisomerase